MGPRPLTQPRLRRRWRLACCASSSRPAGRSRVTERPAVKIHSQMFVEALADAVEKVRRDWLGAPHRELAPSGRDGRSGRRRTANRQQKEHLPLMPIKTVSNLPVSTRLQAKGDWP